MALTKQKLQRPLSFEVPYLHGNWLGDSELILSLPLPGKWIMETLCLLA